MPLALMLSLRPMMNTMNITTPQILRAAAPVMNHRLLKRSFQVSPMRSFAECTMKTVRLVVSIDRKLDRSDSTHASQLEEPEIGIKGHLSQAVSLGV